MFVDLVSQFVSNPDFATELVAGHSEVLTESAGLLDRASCVQEASIDPNGYLGATTVALTNVSFLRALYRFRLREAEEQRKQAEANSSKNARADLANSGSKVTEAAVAEAAATYPERAVAVRVEGIRKAIVDFLEDFKLAASEWHRTLIEVSCNYRVEQKAD